MKKFYSFLIAALMLAIPVGMMGQTRTVVTTTFKAGTSYSAGMTLPCETGGLEWVTSAKPQGFESASPSRGIQYSKVSTDITTTIANASVTKVEVVASTNANANANSLSVYVGSTQIGSTQNMPKENNKTYTFESSSGLSGEIKVSMSNDGTKSTYVKSIAVTYTTGGGSSAVATTTTITVPSGFNNDLKNGTAAGTLTASVTETANGNAVSGATVTWESSNTDVATINASGVVTLKAVGNTTITASYAGTNAYEASSEDYELEVVDSRYLVSDLTFTAACGGSGTADDGAEWTVTSDANESNFDSGRGIHYGTNSANVTYVQLTTSDIDGEIKKVVVNASDAIGASTISVSVGGVAFTCTGSTTVTNSNPGVDYTFNGTGTGEIIVRLDRGTAQTKAIYVKSVKVTYQEPAVKAPQITVPETFVGSTTATITCETTGATIKYSYDGGSTWNTYSTDLSITETTTIYAKAVLGEDESSVVSKTTTKTKPTPTVTISASGINNTDVYGGTTAGNLSATVTYNNNAISGASVTWSGNADAVATINASTGAVTLVSAGQVTFTATFAGNADYLESSATYVMTVTNTDPDRPGTQDNPYTVAQAISAIAHNGYVEDVYATGIVSSIVTAYGTNNYSNITFDIVDTAGDEAYLRAYRCGGTNADQVAVGDVVVVSGTMTYYNSSIYEFNQGCELVSLTHPVNTEPYITIESDEFELTAAVETGELEIEYGNFTLTSFDIQFYDNENNELNEGPDWLTLAIEEDGGNYSVSYATVVNEGTARTAYFKVYDGEVYSNLVTITQAAPVVDYASLPFVWDEKATSTTGLTSSHVSTNNTSPYLKLNDNNNNLDGCVILKLNEAPGVIAFDIKGNPGSGTYSSGTFTVAISADGENYTTIATYTTIVNKIQTMYFTNLNDDTRYIKWSYAKESGNVALGKFNIQGIANQSATITPESNHIYVVNSGATMILDGDYSTTLTNADNLIIEDGGELITHYAVAATVKKEVAAATNWGTATTYDADAWYFIASPVDNTSYATALTTGTEEDYDLYMLDWATKNWLNKKDDANLIAFGDGFTRGTGYLYASKAGNTLSVGGQIQPLSNNDDATVTLANDGWNLIGNPLTCKVTVDHDFGMLNNGSTIDYTGTTVNPFQGIVVWGSLGETVTFTKATSQNAAAPGNSALQMTLAKNVTSRGTTSTKVVDNAVVSFNSESSLPKFTMLEGGAKIYFPIADADYAIVSSDGHGTMPVNFKAAEDGQYTISVNAENVEMSYLHLIDNLTGANVDLLATPSYTFNGKTTDYASRFRLVFSANEANAENDNFAFFSNGQIILSGDNSNATLQVIDMMGRIVSTQQVNGNAVMAPVANGVYVLQLINGNEVKTQKIVVK